MRVILLLAATLFGIVCVHAETASAPMRAWDNIVSANLFVETPIEVEPPQQEGVTRVYTYVRKDPEGELLLSVVVKIGPVGSQIDSSLWHREFDSANSEAQQRNFPKIGMRAQRQTGFFSPEGSSEGVAFTTSDSLFDVLVSVFHASSEIEFETIPATDAASRVDAAYRETFE